MGDMEEVLIEVKSDNQPLLQPKENGIMKHCGYIMTILNVIVVLLLIIGVIVGILKINNKI